jgi:DNA repair exonuclease SbcCD nuclease subunit
LGYEAYPALATSGNNQRGEDIARAFRNVVIDIEAYDPDFVIHGGDLGEKPKIEVRYMRLAQKMFARMTKRRDGSRRPVILIAGNHDLPRSRKEDCWLDMLDQLEHVYVVCHSYEVIDLGSKGYGPELDNVMVHAVPHDVLKEVDFDLVRPVAGKRNILTSHGVAAGSELFTRSLGREYAISSDVLARDWEYVALGHFHKRGPVSIAGARDNRIWYCGSSENISFRDLKENGTERGYLQVRLDPELVITPVNLPLRRMIRLPVIEAEGMSPEIIEATLLERVENGDVDGAVVGQVIDGISRDVWSLVDSGKVRARASLALHYEITPRYAKVETPRDEAARDLGDLSSLLDAEVVASVPGELRGRVLALARKLLGNALNTPEVTEEVEDALVEVVAEKEDAVISEPDGLAVSFDDIVAEVAGRGDEEWAALIEGSITQYGEGEEGPDPVQGYQLSEVPEDIEIVEVVVEEVAEDTAERPIAKKVAKKAAVKKAPTKKTATKAVEDTTGGGGS